MCIWDKHVMCIWDKHVIWTCYVKADYFSHMWQKVHADVRISNQVTKAEMLTSTQYASPLGHMLIGLVLNRCASLPWCLQLDIDECFIVISTEKYKLYHFLRCVSQQNDSFLAQKFYRKYFAKNMVAFYL